MPGKSSKDKKTLPKVTRYPSGVVVTPATCDISVFIKTHGGSLPNINSKTKKYPKQDDVEGWKKLYSAALTHRNKEVYCYKNGFQPPSIPTATLSKYKYVLYHSCPKSKKARAQRNMDRRKHGLQKGDKLVVHHVDPDNIHNSRSVKLTHCQHQRVHGKTCKREKKNKS